MIVICIIDDLEYGKSLGGYIRCWQAYYDVISAVMPLAETKIGALMRGIISRAF